MKKECFYSIFRLHSISSMRLLVRNPIHTMSRNKTYVSLGQLSEFCKRPDADLYLIKAGVGIFSDFHLIKFSTRTALEAFNKKAGLKPLVYTQVPKNCAIYKHESDSVARATATV